MKNVLVVSHADADGHVIAEQVRRNLSTVQSFVVDTVVDPSRTRDHRVWTRLDTIPEVESAEIVLFVDLMFAPASYAAEADALTDFARQWPEKLFFVLDHHPLPLGLLRRAPNIRAVYRRDVFDCTFGTASWLMVIAALLEKQPTRVSAQSQQQEALAKGIKRAAAIGGPLPGKKLLALLRAECWTELIELGRDDAAFHRLPRGLRPSGDPLSEVMGRLDKHATSLLKSPREKGGGSMSYDLELVPDGAPLPTSFTTSYAPSDLQALVTLLELAAIYLTHEPDSVFTADQLFEQAQRLGGDKMQLEGIDLKIVLGKSGFLKKLPGGRFRLK